MRIAAFFLALFFLIPAAHAQVDAGFAKIATVSGTAYADTGCADGTACFYEVTAYNANGESAPANAAVAFVPSSGSHTVNLSWSAGVGTPPTGYYVYREAAPTSPFDTARTGRVAGSDAAFNQNVTGRGSPATLAPWMWAKTKDGR